MKLLSHSISGLMIAMPLIWSFIFKHDLSNADDDLIHKGGATFEFFGYAPHGASHAVHFPNLTIKVCLKLIVI